MKQQPKYVLPAGTPIWTRQGKNKQSAWKEGTLAGPLHVRQPHFIRETGTVYAYFKVKKTRCRVLMCNLLQRKETPLNPPAHLTARPVTFVHDPNVTTHAPGSGSDDWREQA